MKLSVVIPTINEEKYLEKTLESFKQQTVQGFEIIISDGGSTDKTCEIAQKYGAIVTVHKNSTVTQARQYGADVATGDIIIGADADTLYPKKHIETIKNKFESDPKLVALGGPAEFEPHPKWVYLGWRAIYQWIKLHYSITHSVLYVPAFNLSFRKSALAAIGGYRMYLDYAGDEIDILYRLQRIGKVIFVPELVPLASSRRAKVGATALVIKHTLIDYYLGYMLSRLFQRPILRGSPVR
jgi:peptidoglycan-N-acetylglucosamine deacetylase